jgi:hypothetical protein
MHNVSLREEIDRRAWERRGQPVQAAIRAMDRTLLVFPIGGLLGRIREPPHLGESRQFHLIYDQQF